MTAAEEAPRRLVMRRPAAVLMRLIGVAVSLSEWLAETTSPLVWRKTDD